MKMLIVAVAAAVSFAGCTGKRTSPVSALPSEPSFPEVTTAQAEDAMSDAMLVSAVSLFLAFNAQEGAREVGNEDGSLRLSWDESADPTTGVGLYTITMTDYTMDAQEPYSDSYNGYVLNGTVVMGSTDGVSQRMTIDLSTSHEDPENYPVRAIDLLLESSQDESQPPTGHVSINGHEMDLEEVLTGARTDG